MTKKVLKHDGGGAAERGEALARVHAALVGAGAVQRSETEWSCFRKDKHVNDDKTGSLTVRYGDKRPDAVMLACAKCGGIDNLLTGLRLTPADLIDAAPAQKTRRYVYRDEAGQPLSRVVKLPGIDGGKSRTFQQRPDGHGGWLNGVQGVPRVLYRLDELLQAIGEGRAIHLTEGESDADALNAWFIGNRANAFATCHPGGAGKWLPAHTQTLAGAARVVVWADRDGPGYACAHLRLSALRAAGLKASARQPASGKDVRDHLGAGLTPEDGEKLKPAALAKLAGGAADDEREEEPDDDNPALTAAMDRLRLAKEAARRVAAEEAAVGFVPLPRRTLKEALTDRPEDPPELIERLHRRGYNTTITARYKTGKTTLGGNLLRSLADGVPFLDRFAVATPLGRVGLLNYELTDADMLTWLDDQGIDNTDRIALLNLRGRALSLAHDRGRDELVQWCQDMEVTTLFLDPHRRAFAGFGEENSNDDVNRFTGVLDEVKAAAGVEDLFLFVHTGRESATAGNERARGATALDDWADQRWLMTRGTAADDNTRYLYADGRMAAVPEFGLAYDPATRRLSAQDGNRRTQADDSRRGEVLAVLEATGPEGANTTQIETALGSTKKGGLSKLLQSIHGQGYIAMRGGGIGKEKRYWLPENAPKEQA